ncbi:MAG TPA: ABC transporter transmembrane domain-containing protein [Ignavibacteriaceae bacterium]|nr:ABC transporter transmembrane domain-containing protein [Ignavibacteriaceae bacterium]
MNTYIRIVSYVKPYWKHLSASILFTFLFAIFNGLSVYLTIPLLDTLFQESSFTQQTVGTQHINETTGVLPGWVLDFKDEVTKTFNDFVLSGSKIDALMRICFLVLITFLLKNITGYLQAYFMAHVEYGAMKDLRDEAYSHLHQLPMSYFKKERVGNLISRFTNDVIIVQSSITAAFSNLIKEPLTIIVFLGIALSISWQLTLVAFIALPFSMLIIGWIGLRLRRQSSVVQAKIADITSILQETISAVKIVKAFGMEKYENKKFTKETHSFFKLMLRIVRIRNIASPVTEFLSVVVGVFIIYYGGVMVLQQDTLKASEFLGFLFAIFQMMPPIKELTSVNNRIQEASAAGDRIFEILDTKPSIKNKPGAVGISGFKDKIEFENIFFSYEDSQEPVLKNISFTANRGDVVALVGPSGGGKSTLVDLLPRFHDPDSGRICIDGIDIKDLKIEDLRGLMGIVTQETYLFNESIRNNIAYGREDYPMEKIIQAAEMANAHNFILELPDGYNTIIGERGMKLSGGQRQRISIARALVKNPEIMIFDEATSALDNESELLVQEAIERMMQNRTTFVIAHRLSTIRHATKILVLDYGRIIQHGRHHELIADESGLYNKLYEMQFRD